eukprot:TRINITY_DN2958_c0_g1_i1.p1 TRINITY_DN2958_c0_g1~~TRINITY_DN2958_c0_g1_i1.p1  ORF type:complete len:1936 (-),score=358.88 TRINITY_DN2958_c0_g1_i1:26-5833(-)
MGAGKLVRERTPTGFVHKDMHTGSEDSREGAANHPNGRSVSFGGDVGIGESASCAPSVSSVARSVRERTPTGHISGDALQEIHDRSGSFRADVVIGEAASTLGSSDARLVRERTPTGFIGAETVQVVDDRSVNLTGDMSVGESASSSSMEAGKSVRERTPTGFVHKDVHTGSEDSREGAANHPNGRSVSFGGDVGIGESASFAPSVARSVRERTPTGHISGYALQEISDRSVSFRADVIIGEAASTLGSSDARPVRERTPTGFIGAETAQVVDDKSVNSSGGVSVCQSASSSSMEAGKLVRERTPTGFVHKDVPAGADDVSAAGGHSNGRSVTFGRDVSIGESSSCAPLAGRSVRERKPTGHVSDDVMQDISEKSVSFSGDVVLGEAASVLSSADARPVRERTPTGFIDRETAQLTSGKSVSVDAGVPTSGSSTQAGESIRARIPTGFVREDIDAQKETIVKLGDREQIVDDANDAKQVTFGREVTIGEAASMLSGAGARPVRDRTPTGFMHDSTAQGEDAARSVSFNDSVSMGQAASVASSQSARPVRGRTPTGFTDNDTAESFNQRAVSFCDDVTLLPSASSSSIVRPVRGRTPTGHVDHATVASHDNVKRDVSTESHESSECFRNRLSKGQIESIRQAAWEGAKAAAAAAKSKAARKTRFDDANTSVGDAASRAAAPGLARPLRTRELTGYLSGDVTEAAKQVPDTQRKTVSVALGSRDLQDDAHTGLNTGELSETQGRAVSFAQDIVVEDAASMMREEGSRSVIGRVPTAFLPLDTMEMLLHRPQVNFSNGSEDHVREDSRQSHNDEGTPGERSVSFRPNLSLVEFDQFSNPGSPTDENGAKEGTKGKRIVAVKSVRNRVQTSWVAPMPSDERCVRFVESVPVDDGDRLGWTDTSSTKSNAESEASSAGSSVKQGGRQRRSSDEEDPISDAETVSSASSRNPRSRMSTPFMSAVDWGYEVGQPATKDGDKGKEGTAASSSSMTGGADSSSSVNVGRRPRRQSKQSSESSTPGIDRHQVKQVSMESSVEREITERVKLNAQRQARADRIIQLGGADARDANVPLELERNSAIDGLEADLNKRIVPGAVKDSKLLRNTLRKLVFFETFDDDAIHCLIEAMEVYEFQDGEKAVRQGDTDGTHFFVVADGEFCVLRDNVPKVCIGPGASFGESVLLLFGERNATVCAKGCARAYGMEGMAVRELLREQYEQRHESVVEAADEVLSSGKCDILSRLNAYQLQNLYDQVEMKTFSKGEIILLEGRSCNEVLILYTGSVTLLSQGRDIGMVPEFGLMGDRALTFPGQQPACEQPATLVAATQVQTLVLKRALLDSIFGDRLEQALVKNRLMYTLGMDEVFSRLHSEQREDVASACQIRSLRGGFEEQWEDVRFVATLNGEVELTLVDSPEPQVRELAGASLSMFGAENLDRWHSPWPLKVKATTDSRLAIWHKEDLDHILEFNDFDVALEQQSKVRILQSVFIFATLGKQQLQRLAKALEKKSFKSGETVFSQGEHGSEFYIIRKGRVQVEIDGKRLRTLGLGDYFGERALLGSEIRSARVTTMEDTELWKMGKETFQEMMQGPCLDYLMNRISLQDTKLTFKDLEFMRVIGRGGFGIVKMVRASHTGVRYALKCVRKRDVVEKGVQDALVSELSIMAEVDHPFIIKFVRSFRNETRVYFLMELVSGGELLDALDWLGLLKHSQAVFYTGCIVLALEFLHARHIAYLDLKSENCLIDQQGYLKLIDFGIARRITNTRYGPLKGTPMFMSPEMIIGKGHTTVADLWSLGICLYEFVVGNFPFANNCANHGQIFHEILRAKLEFPPWFEKQPMADEIVSLIRGLLTRDPKQRLGAGHEGYPKLKSHAFFKNFCWERLLAREVEPPFVPSSETYAEDKETKRGHGKNLDDERLLTVEAEEAACEEREEAWEDPDPGWDADF